MESNRRAPCCRQDERGVELAKIWHICRPDACGAHIIEKNSEVRCLSWLYAMHTECSGFHKLLTYLTM